jgi:hypothetical protein
MKTKIQSIKKIKLKSLNLKKDEIMNESKLYNDIENEDSLDEATLSDQETIYKTSFINEEDSIKRKIKELYLDMEWIERLDSTVENNDELNKLKLKDLVYNDFERENYFYKQALLSVSEALPKLNNFDVKTKRPGDFFAKMTKSDQHMKKIQEILQTDHVEKKEQIDQIRELNNLGKQIKEQAQQYNEQVLDKSNKLIKFDKKDSNM